VLDAGVEFIDGFVEGGNVLGDGEDSFFGPADGGEDVVVGSFLGRSFEFALGGGLFHEEFLVA
jgi:hypothetical protein